MDLDKGDFYLGRETESGDPIVLPADDLTTHGVIVGMTGSGKTGLAVGLIAEAAIDGIPVLAIDPKGDLGNLLLTFPSLAAAAIISRSASVSAPGVGTLPSKFLYAKVSTRFTRLPHVDTSSSLLRRPTL